MPLFSVVIPLYNKATYIQETIESVLQQTYTDFELIVVDDASTDASLTIVEGIQDSRIRCIQNPKNLGLSATRNVGINAANSELIALLDADDSWLPTFLETIHELYNRFPEASIFGTDYIEKYKGQEGLEPKKNIDISKKDTMFLVEDFFETSMHLPILCQSSIAFKASMITSEKIFNPKITFAEDIDFYIKYGSISKIAYAYKALSEVRFGIPNQLSKASIGSKVLPDLDIYEPLATQHISLKKYLDLYRYIFASLYTLEGESEKKKAVLAKVDYRNLTFKQRVLLKSPRFVVVLLKKVKAFLLRRNVRVTSF